MAHHTTGVGITAVRVFLLLIYTTVTDLQLLLTLPALAGISMCSSAAALLPDWVVSRQCARSKKYLGNFVYALLYNITW